MPTEPPLTLLIGEYYRLARMRELLAERAKRHTSIELSTITEVDALLEDAMSCDCCGRAGTDANPIGRVEAFGIETFAHAQGCPDVIACVNCDKPAEARCPGCQEHFCPKCLPMCGGEPGLCAWCLEEMEEPNADINTDLRGEAA